jgi:hypothetical protein
MLYIFVRDRPPLMQSNIIQANLHPLGHECCTIAGDGLCAKMEAGHVMTTRRVNADIS